MKLVKESLQPLQFQRGLDPKNAMGIGKYAKIKAWLEEMDIENYIINDDFTIDVDGFVYLQHKDLNKFPDYIQSGKVGGWFDCGNNKLTSLKGAPKFVTRSFYCNNNKKEFTKAEVQAVCNVKGNIIV
jgi:hypothetical protein